MQTILNKLNNDKLTKEEIIEITSETKRHDVLLQVMKMYPERKGLILTIAQEKCTVTDYEYAKGHLNQEIVTEFERIIFKKFLTEYKGGQSELERCHVTRNIFGPYHRTTKAEESNIESLAKAINLCTRGHYSEYHVDEIVGYMRGTIEGARKIIEIIDDIDDIDDIGDDIDDLIDRFSIYDDGDMLERVLVDMDDLDLAYKIARRIDPIDLDDTALCSAIYNYPDEDELHRIIAEKQPFRIDDIEYIEEEFPGKTEILDILKRRR